MQKFKNKDKYFNKKYSNDCKKQLQYTSTLPCEKTKQTKTYSSCIGE